MGRKQSSGERPRQRTDRRADPNSCAPPYRTPRRARRRANPGSCTSPHSRTNQHVAQTMLGHHQPHAANIFHRNRLLPRFALQRNRIVGNTQESPRDLLRVRFYHLNLVPLTKHLQALPRRRTSLTQRNTSHSQSADQKQEFSHHRPPLQSELMIRTVNHTLSVLLAT